MFRVTGFLCEEFTGHQWIPLTKASDGELCYIFFDLHQNKRLSIRSDRRWFKMPLCSLWHHCNSTREDVPVPFQFWEIIEMHDISYDHNFSSLISVLSVPSFHRLTGFRRRILISGGTLLCITLMSCLWLIKTSLVAGDSGGSINLIGGLIHNSV